MIGQFVGLGCGIVALERKALGARKSAYPGNEQQSSVFVVKGV
jgi:hypothetical protein